MANRALIAKADRAKRQRMEAAQAEFTKPCWLSWRDGSGTRREELAAMVAGFHGDVKVLPAGRYVAPEGKGKRRAFRETGGDGTRRIGLSARSLVAW